MPRLSWLALAIAVFGLTAAPASAVTSWVPDNGNVHQADEAIVPANLGATGPDAFEPDDNAAAAASLRVGGAPQDHVMVAGEQDWYKLWAVDGAGYVRVGSTGDLRIAYALRPTDQPDFVAGFGGPPAGADLIEAWVLPDTEYAADLGVDAVYMIVETPSTRPVAYRISFVKELPTDRTGATTPAIATEEFLKGLIRGDLSAMYEHSGTRYTEEQAAGLRQELLGRQNSLEGGIDTHGSPTRGPDEDEHSPVQHLVISIMNTPDDIWSWAFVVTCEERDELWVVTDVRRDPDLTDEQVSSFVRRDYEAMFGQPIGSGPDKAATEAPSSAATLVWVAAGVGVAVIAGGVVLWVRRRHAAPRPRRAGVALRVAAFGETTGWAGKSILFEDELFVLEGCGVVSATDVMQYDRQGHLVWSSEGMRAWVGAKAAAVSASSGETSVTGSVA